MRYGDHALVVHILVKSGSNPWCPLTALSSPLTFRTNSGADVLE